MTTDKYEVNPLDGPSRLAEAWADLDRRVAALEGAPMVGSSVVAFDPTSGEELVRVGNLGDGTWGILVTNANGRTLFRVDTVGGQTAPQVNPVPVTTASALLSGTAIGFRPGTDNGTFTSIWAHEWWSVGDKIDYDLRVVPNANVMQWQIIVAEVGAPAVVTVGPITDTAVTHRSGTFVIPATALVSGTDPTGRLMRMDVQARNTTLGLTYPTVDISLNQAPRNYG